MQIEHIGIWTRQLEVLKTFYETYFLAKAGPKYTNPNTHFESYFLTFSAGARIELMQAPNVTEGQTDSRMTGYAHLAIAVGTKEEVDRLTGRLAADGFRTGGLPRTTGDGYYESIIFDPDGNQVEITV